MHLNDEIEKSRGYDYSPVGSMYAGNTNSCAVNTSNVVNQHYSPPDHLVQQDFLNAYNQIFKQQPQQRNLSFMQYSAKNLNYLDTIQQQQQQQQQNEQKKNMRHCLSSSDTSRYMDASIDGSLRMPTSYSSSYSFHNSILIIQQSITVKLCQGTLASQACETSGFQYMPQIRASYGTEGKQTRLRSNHFSIKMQNRFLFQYAVTICPDNCPKQVNR